MLSRTRPQDEVFGVDYFVGGTDAAATSSKPVVQPNQQFGLCHTENVKNQPKPWPMHLSGNPNCNMIGQNKGSDEMWTYDTQGRITLHVDDAEPRPVHDRVPHVDRHHIGSSPDGARPVHEWIHRCTSGTLPARLRHEFFHTLNIDVDSIAARTAGGGGGSSGTASNSIPAAASARKASPAVASTLSLVASRALRAKRDVPAESEMEGKSDTSPLTC